MYWIYLAIFILAILTPKFVQQGAFPLQEDDVESLLILGFGTFGLVLYFAKEKALLRVFKEKLHLQKQANIITRDLSDSYSYIGEMNRKLDIVKELIFSLPKTTAETLGKKEGAVYQSLLDAASLLAKTDAVTLCFVDTKRKEWVKRYQKQTNPGTLPGLDAKTLLEEGKFFWEIGEDVIVRSPRQAKGVSAFLIFSKTRNHIEDGEVFQILASEALLLYWAERGATSYMDK